MALCAPHALAPKPAGRVTVNRTGSCRGRPLLALPIPTNAPLEYSDAFRPSFALTPARGRGLRWRARASLTSAEDLTGFPSGGEGNLHHHLECDALIAGAGPAGLATALLLARRPGWERIILLDKRASIDAEAADKSYVYGIDWRGFSLADATGLTTALESVSVSNDGNPISYVTPDGALKTLAFPERKGKRSPVSVSRRDFLKTLYGGLAEAEQTGRVRLLNQVQVTRIRLAADVGSGGGSAAAPPPPIVVHARDAASGAELRFAPRLLVGADGVHSEVRRALQGWAQSAGLTADRYSPVVLDSPSAGLRFKVLRLPPNTPFRRKLEQPTPPTPPQQQQQQRKGYSVDLLRGFTGAGRDLRSVGLEATPGGRLENARPFMLVGASTPAAAQPIMLGMFPVRDPDAPRTATVVARGDHVFWSFTSGRQLGAFLQASFPQLDISSLLDEQELDAAVASRGGTFPPPQHLQHFTAVLPAAAGAATAGSGSSGRQGSSCGVALVGDAVHSFPPDLAQGTNSAMMDVLGLAKALDDSGGDLGRALPLYEERQAPEAAALAELETFGAPFQYSQDKVGVTLWFANYLLRQRLSQLAPWCFSPQLVGLMRDTTLSYSEMLQRVHATTRRIWALAALLVAALVALAAAAAGA